MGFKTTQYVTATCDVIGCEKEIIRTTETEILNEDSGWSSENIFGEEWLLCPQHVHDLKRFLNEPPF